MDDWTSEFIVTVLAILLGLIIGKKISRWLATKGTKIVSGNPIVVPLMPKKAA